LVVKNTGTQTMSSFSFALLGGTTANGTAGNIGCAASSNTVTCSNPTPPGQSQFVDILSSPTPAVGSTGTLTIEDQSGVAQPGQSVTLQSSSACASGTSTTTCTIGTTTSSTTTQTNTTAGCAPVKLAVSKSMEPTPMEDNGYLEVNSVTEVPRASNHYDVASRHSAYLPSGRFVVTVKNDGDCPATDVELADRLPSNVNYLPRSLKQVTGPATGILQTPNRGGNGGTFRVYIPSLPSGGSVQYRLDVALDGAGTNTACVTGSFVDTCSDPVDWSIVPAPHADIAGGSATSVQG
jgi:uncharacterized repeat protein (TIGR01451 family)